MAKAKKKKKARKARKGGTSHRVKFGQASRTCTAKVRGEGYAFGEKAGWKAFGKCMKAAL